MTHLSAKKCSLKTGRIFENQIMQNKALNFTIGLKIVVQEQFNDAREATQQEVVPFLIKFFSSRCYVIAGVAKCRYRIETNDTSTLSVLVFHFRRGTDTAAWSTTTANFFGVTSLAIVVATIYK